MTQGIRKQSEFVNEVQQPKQAELLYWRKISRKQRNR